MYPLLNQSDESQHSRTIDKSAYLGQHTTDLHHREPLSFWDWNQWSFASESEVRDHCKVILSLISASVPVALTGFCQYSLTATTRIIVGRLGRSELAAVSLASTVANITGFVVFQGLASALETLCGQSYGAGMKRDLGLHLQRMVLLLWCASIPIAVLWYNSFHMFRMLTVEDEVAALASAYLKVLVFGCPGYACFEAGKRYLQAQGCFAPASQTLAISVCLNGMLSWLLVWHYNWDFIGGAIALTATVTMLPAMLFISALPVMDRKCWTGLHVEIFRDWQKMLSLAIPSMVMLESECLAFNSLTFMAGRLGTSSLAAQAILATFVTWTFMIGYAINVATSLKVAIQAGAGSWDDIRVSVRSAYLLGLGGGLFNTAVLIICGGAVTSAFTSDEEILVLVSKHLPLCASFQVIDALVEITNGIFRGLGKQKHSAYVHLLTYYLFGLPFSACASNFWGWNIAGLWLGIALSLWVILIVQALILRRLHLW